MSIVINFDAKKMETVQNMLSGIKGGAERAMSRAINRTVSYGKTQSSRLIRKEYTIDAQSVRNATSETKATSGSLFGVIWFKGRSKQLRSFAVKSSHGRIMASVKRSTGFKRLTRRAFIQTINSGRAVMRRVGEERYPVDVLHALSVPQMVGGTTVGPQIRKAIDTKLEERVEHEMDVLIRGITK